MVDGPVPDTAMDTKSEEGDPGGAEDTSPLTEDERALLERLRAAEGHAAESPAAEAPAADTTLPGSRPAAAPDGLDPVFREPTP
jgi:hypothetical protein